MWERIPWVCLSVVSVFTTTGLGVDNGICSYRKWERPGDVKFLVIAGIRENWNGACGNTSRSIFEQVVALEWILSLLGGNGSTFDSYIPGVTVGYDLYDNCDNEDLTIDLLYSGIPSVKDPDCRQDLNNSSVYIGAISLTTPRATNIIARLLHPLPVFRPLASSPVLITHDHPNLLQSVVSFREEAIAITKMLSSIRWNFIVVVHTSDAAEEATEFIKIARSSGICVNFTGAPDTLTVSRIFTVMNLAHDKSLAVVYFGNSSGAQKIVRLSKTDRPYESRIHWVFTSRLANDLRVEEQLSKRDLIISLDLQESENVQFNSFFRNVMENPQSSLLGELIQWYSLAQDTPPEIQPYPMVDSALSVVNSAKQVWDTQCIQHDSVRDCSQFPAALNNRMVQNIKAGVNVLERFDSRYLPTLYNKTLQYLQDGTQAYDSLYLTLYNTTTVMDLGRFIAGEYVSEPNVPLLPSSACRLYCIECQEQLDLRYSYLHGDVLILGLFSLSQFGVSPYSCGHIRRGTNDIITVSSFIQSVIVRRNQTGVNFGAIAIDDCYNGLNTSHYLTDLFSKRRTITDPSDPSRVINFDNVIAIVGALSSSVTLVVADLATAIRLPVISYSASSPELDNRNRYPFFLRTVPSDTLQVQGMVSVLLELGVSHVGLVYLDDAYGQGGKLRLQQEALSRNICVEDPISVTQNMKDEYVEIDVIKKLYTQQVIVVLLFAIDSVVQQILDVMVAKFGTSRDPLIFISSEGWGSNLNLLSQASVGSIVFNIAAQAYSDNHYIKYLNNLRPYNNDENRWLPRYFEDYNKCDMISSFEKTFVENNEAKICGDGFKPALDANTTRSLSEDQRYIHTLLSVFAVTDGFHKFCPYKNTCSSNVLKTNIDRFYDFIKTARYMNDIPIFDDDGNGHIGYTIHNIQLSGSLRKYIQIGTYQNGKLHLTKRPKFYSNVWKEMSLQEEYSTEINCYKFIGACSDVCPSHETATTTVETTSEETTTKANETDSSLMVMTIVFGVFMAVLLIALVLVVVILFRIQNRQTKQLSDRGESVGRTTSVSDVHSVYDEPGSVRRKTQFDNHFFMPDTSSLRSRPHTPSSAHGLRVGGSVSSLNVQQVQYADVRQMSNPEINIHHVRQISHQEPRNNWFDSLERPTSTLSAPAYKPNSHQKSPIGKRMVQPSGANQKPYKQAYVPKTPHSAPTESRQQVIHRPRAQSSPRFRYPSTISSDESHYTMPKLDSFEDMPLQRKLGVSDDDIHEDFDALQNTEDVCNSENYLYPDSSLGNEPQLHLEPESKITYLTAKDLVMNDSENEEDISPETDEVVQYSGVESRTNAPPQVMSIETQTADKAERITSTKSPTDCEVMNINFPPSNNSLHLKSKNAFHDQNNLKSNTKPNHKTGHGVREDGKNSREPTASAQAVVYQKNNSHSSISDVPDIIKHGAYEEDGVKHGAYEEDGVKHGAYEEDGVKHGAYEEAGVKQSAYEEDGVFII